MLDAGSLIPVPVAYRSLTRSKGGGFIEGESDCRFLSYLRLCGLGGYGRFACSR